MVWPIRSFVTFKVTKPWRKRQRMFLRMVGEYGRWLAQPYSLSIRTFAICKFTNSWRKRFGTFLRTYGAYEPRVYIGKSRAMTSLTGAMTSLTGLTPHNFYGFCRRQCYHEFNTVFWKSCIVFCVKPNEVDPIKLISLRQVSLSIALKYIINNSVWK